MEYTVNLLFASNNRGKYDELYQDFANQGINLIFDGNLALEETTGILSENATQKARDAARAKDMLALGDDSGVFVEALDYFPGVNSRRWFASEKDDHARNKKILDMMKDENDRRAYLISRFTVVTPKGEIIAKASVKNEFDLAYKESGANGFGYDNILIPSKNLLAEYLSRTDAFSRDDPDYIHRAETAEWIEEERITVAELSQDLKNEINNRGGKIAPEISQQIEEFYSDTKGDDI